MKDSCLNRPYLTPILDFLCPFGSHQVLRGAADEAASVHVQRADAMRAAMDAMQVRVRVLCVCVGG